MRKISAVSLASMLVFGLFLAAEGFAAAESGEITSVDAAGRKHVVRGYVPMKAAPGAKTYQASPELSEAALPKKVDLRGMMSQVENQGETSSCVANALAGAYEYWIKRATKSDYDISRLFVYYNARWRSGDHQKDEGSVIQLAMEGLGEFGACPETVWPFEKPLLLEKPNSAAYQEASHAKVKEMQAVPTELTAWKQALASGLPIVFGCLLFDSFDQCNQKGGVVPMPSPADVSRSTHAGHAMCAVGYSDKEQVFIVRNSWGDQWGDKGYCYMPYNYLMNPEFNGGDSWVFVPETPIENPQDTWFNDDQPVTDGGRGVDFVINPYQPEDYATVTLTWWEDVAVDYVEEEPADYVEYVQYAGAGDWDQMESFDTSDVIASWEAENPGAETDLDSYVDAGDDGQDEEVSGEDAEADDEGEAEDESADEGGEEEMSDEDAEADDEGVVEEPSDDEGGEEEMSDEDAEVEDEGVEEDPSGDEGGEEEMSDEDAEDEGGEEEMSDEDAEAEDEGGAEDASDDESGEEEMSGEEDAEDEDEGVEEDPSGDEGGDEGDGGEE